MMIIALVHLVESELQVSKVTALLTRRTPTDGGGVPCGGSYARKSNRSIGSTMPPPLLSTTTTTTTLPRQHYVVCMFALDFFPSFR
jgi:hypothetical protein